MDECIVKLNKEDLVDLICALDKQISQEIKLGHMGKIERLDSMQALFKNIIEGKDHEAA